MTTPATADRKPNLLDESPESLANLLSPLDLPDYRVKQVAEWTFDKRASDFRSMTNLPIELRSELGRRFSLARPETIERTARAEDGSYKLLFSLVDGLRVEAVSIPMKARTTICVSSQAGCAVGCTFCVTGFFGPGRNLSPAEILGQIHAIQEDAELSFDRINVVFMGMGEPLLNEAHLHRTLRTLYRNVSPRRVTVSTSGIVPGIDALARLDQRPNLAVSLNAPDQARREEIMPITRKFPLDSLVDSLKRFPLERGRTLTFEYVLLAGWNDSPKDARQLARLTRGLRAKVNVIPFNPDERLPSWMNRPDDESIDRFAAALRDDDVRVTVRRSKGLEIAAACGQLKGR